ncbi:phosphate transporter (Pho88) [Dispira parvispora]|uniref:Phosphate transporter (Pho88) n=1 Tax=Dispira parvispora TaxID=1520584 RepID=A0A9W8ANR5_9FUNG|nr:phosphate transporter (Pho88) [Dispira parvispora]
MSGLGGQMSNMVLVLGLVQLAKHLNLEDPIRVQWVLIGFVVSNVLILGGCYYLKFLIMRKNDHETLKYMEPASPGNPQGREVETTLRDYDLGEVSKQINSVLLTLGMLGFMHYQWGFVQPLFLQSVLPIKSFLTSNLVRIHILGQAAEGSLERPWRPENPFGKLGEAVTSQQTVANTSTAPRFEELSSSESSEDESSDEEVTSDAESVKDKKTQ